MFCRECGTSMKEGERFCRECGTEILHPVPTKMFCRECGMEMNSGEQFCKECGTPVLRNTSDTVQTAPEKSIKEGIKQHKRLAALLFVSAVLQLVYLFLRGCDTVFIKVAIDDYFRTQTISMKGWMESTPLGTLSVVLIIVSVVLCVLPVILCRIGKKQRLILPKLTSFWNLFWHLILLSVASDSVTQRLSVEEEVSWGMTPWGWMIFVLLIASLVLLFMASAVSKKRNT